MRYDDDNKSIRIYLQEIGQVALLTREEEVQLAKRIHKGDEKAKHHMISANLRLVVKIAHDYAQYGLPLLDLISEGNLGLIKAVERFDPRKGGKLSTYAAWWIKQSIKRALANQSKTIRLPAHLVDKISKMRKTAHKMTEELGREPTTDELAARLDVTPATIETWQVVALRPTSLDAPIAGAEDGEIGDLIGDTKAKTPFEELNDRQLREEIEKLQHRLDKREREILKYRYGLQGATVETLEEVGKRFNITRERVRQIQNSAVDRLREMLEEQDRPAAERQAQETAAREKKKPAKKKPAKKKPQEKK